MATEPRRAYADTPFGQLHHVEQGSGEPLLLLHQTPRSWDEFRELIPLLAPRHRVIAMDMLGMGQSPAQGPGQTIEQMAAAAWALLDALGVERVHVLGHHTGAVVATEMAAARPDAVGGLILSSPAYTDAEYRAAHANGPGVDEAERSEDGSHLVTLWDLRRPFYPQPSAALLDRFLHDALSYGIDPAEGHIACARYVMEDRLPLVTAATLLVDAAADPFASPSVPPVRAGLTAARATEVTRIEGGMIPLMEQCPSEVAAAVLDFLSRHPL